MQLQYHSVFYFVLDWTFFCFVSFHHSLLLVLLVTVIVPLFDILLTFIDFFSLRPFVMSWRSWSFFTWHMQHFLFVFFSNNISILLKHIHDSITQSSLLHTECTLSFYEKKEGKKVSNRNIVTQLSYEQLTQNILVTVAYRQC